MHLHVPLAAHPDGDAGRGDADRHLQRLAGRAARQGAGPQAPPRAAHAAPPPAFGRRPQARIGRRPRPREVGARPTRRALAVGDCVDCTACVNVCPMGIDIRNGQQMECITCALCIDACDDVMAKRRPAARPDRLLHPHRREAELAGGRRQADLAPRLPAPDDPLHRALVAGRAWSCSSALCLRTRDRASRPRRSATRSS